MSPTAGLDALGETNWKSQRGIEPRLYCTVPYRTVLYCTVLYCAVLYCTVLYCTVLRPPAQTLYQLSHSVFSFDKMNSCPCPCPCRDSIWGNLSTAPLIRNLSLTFRTLYRRRKEPWYLLSGKLSGPSPGLDVLEEGKIPCTCRHSNPGHSDSKPTELFKISHNSGELAASISQVSAQRSKWYRSAANK